MADDRVCLKSCERRFDSRRKETCDSNSSGPPTESCQKCRNFNWIDVTEEFFKATEELELGQLLHDDMFGLFEAMSAIEMMDPKMDAGMMCNRGNKKVLNFDQALKADKLKIKDLTVEEQIGIIDATLACLVTWLEGHSLAQTVFTNLYLQKPHMVEDKIIRAFSIHSLKLLDVIRDFINKAGVFEEEDFQPVMYGYKLANDIPVGKATAMLKEVEEELLKKVKLTRSKPGEEQDIEVQTRHEEAVALYSRIKFCRILYQALLLFQKKKCFAVDEVDKFLVQCHELLPIMEKTIHLGIRPDPNAESSNRVCLIQYGSDLFEVVGVLSELLVPNKAKIIFAHVIISPLLFNPQTKEYVETFLGHCVRPFCTLVQITGHNRARQRDKLSHLLEELAALQEEADKVDAFLHSICIKLDNPCTHLACFGTWVLYHTLKVMIQYVLSGFELELYSSHEYIYLFWYLYEFLYGWMVSSLSRANNFLTEQENKADQMFQKGRNNKRSKKKKKIQPHRREIILNQALQNLCGGYYKAVVGFQLDGKLKRPLAEFDKEQVRYEHRFAPFNAVLTPPPVPYNQFQEMTNLPEIQKRFTAEDLYLEACKCFHHARTNLENISEPNEEMMNLLKVAKTNFIVMKLLHSGHKKGSKTPPEFDFSVHKNFPTIKVM
ncbi:N-alpha-acetyltransferase 35 like protein [Argiope bruennichi]|uniref:Protein MAK10 homolog n=1 Tax=Argiope bruennichi TaxID=94029 RepID=A0A8T0E8Z1_ARGBR|nr:N-alpha-acetyltransferase 35 like protein [Argiope bruennichi]